MQHLIGTQARQFGDILYLTAIDIHLGITTTQHLYGTITLGLERRNLCQSIAHGSSLLKDGSCHSCTHGIALNMSFRQLTFYYHLLQQLVILFHLDGKILTSLNI